MIAQVVVEPTSILARGLSVKPLRWLGLISYGTYIWQAPVFGVLDATGHRLPGVPGIVLAVVLGALSYFLIERRFLRLRYRFGRHAAPGNTASQTARSQIRDYGHAGPRLAGRSGSIGFAPPTSGVNLDAE